MATRKQIAARKKNIKKAQKARWAGHRKKSAKKRASSKRKGGKKKSAKKRAAKKKGGKKKSAKKRASSKRASMLTYRAVEKKRAQHAALRARLAARGMPPALINKMMARIERSQGAGKTKSTGWFAGYRAKEAAERAAHAADEYMARNYHRHVAFA